MRQVFKNIYFAVYKGNRQILTFSFLIKTYKEYYHSRLQ